MRWLKGYNKSKKNSGSRGGAVCANCLVGVVLVVCLVVLEVLLMFWLAPGTVGLINSL